MIGVVVRVIAVINLFPYGTVEPGETMTVAGLVQEAIELRLDTPHPELPTAWGNTLWLEDLTEWADRLKWPDGKSTKTVYSDLQKSRRRSRARKDE